MNSMSSIQNAGGAIVWVAIAVIAFFGSWIWRGCIATQDEADAVQLAIEVQKDSCEAKILEERKFFESRLAEIGLRQLNQNEKPISPPTRPITSGKQKQDVHDAIIAALKFSVDSLASLAEGKLLPRTIPDYPFTFENQFVKVDGNLWGTYYPMTETVELTHTFKRFDIKQMLEKEVVVEVEKENTRFFNSLSFGLHAGYSFEPKVYIGMFETYAKLRVSRNVYLVPRYDIRYRYAHKELVRTISFGIDYTIH